MAIAADFETVTELAGAEVSAEQVFRVCNRYYWAGEYCAGKHVLEVACGTGPGLGYISKLANRLVACDISEPIVRRARAHYGDRIEIQQLDAMATGLPDNSFDVILIFEALYYIPDPDRFVVECKRLLRPGGLVLVSNANKDLFDFAPSPHSNVYHGVVELEQLFAKHGFDTEFFGSVPVAQVSMKQRIFRPIKAAAVRFNLMPKTMNSKKFLKRLIFGAPAKMPAEIASGMVNVETPKPLPKARPDVEHKVIYCKAALSN